MDAEQFKLEAEKAQVNLDQFKNQVMQLEAQIGHAKEDRHTCRMDIVKANNNEEPNIDRDTHVNLDMQMWITHNQTVSTTATTVKPYSQYPTQRVYKERPITTYPPSTYKPTTYTTTTPYTTTTAYTTTTPYTTTTTYQAPTSSSYQTPAKSEYSTSSY